MTRAGGPTVSCPACGRRTVFGPGNPWRPFCSERCRTLDLGAWASEQYRIEADADPDPGEDGAPPPSA
ncbi:MAG: DNA gyrase inhibitor YacG [Burkholderiaceae bacterium]|nr:DNA gyrase inhibitor YacG [Burkholderiaceae bacterium]